jgi:hypothetical protein
MLDFRKWLRRPIALLMAEPITIVALKSTVYSRATLLVAVFSLSLGTA